MTSKGKILLMDDEQIILDVTLEGAHIPWV